MGPVLGGIYSSAPHILGTGEDRKHHEIDAATQVVDGMTTYFDIPTLTGAELWDALFNAFSAL
jgi:hypothetical protein